MNPVQAMCDLLSGMKDKNGRITIPGFYDDVIKLSNAEREGFKKLKFNDKSYMKRLGVKELFGEKGYTTLERTGGRPTLELNGIWGGFTGHGAKTVLPSKAYAKFSMRLVPNQTPKKIEKLIQAYLRKNVPKSVSYKVEALHGGEPALTLTDGKAIQAAARAMKSTFGKTPVFTKEGGSIPIVVDFRRLLKAPVVLMGFGLATENLHSPNEHFDLNNFYKGIRCSAIFMEEFAK
jgi:acetylornithine deacetylase/succinyl-diaminopimelate desuccinylase-like protein